MMIIIRSFTSGMQEVGTYTLLMSVIDADIGKSIDGKAKQITVPRYPYIAILQLLLMSN